MNKDYMIIRSDKIFFFLNGFDFCHLVTFLSASPHLLLFRAVCLSAVCYNWQISTQTAS